MQTNTQWTTISAYETPTVSKTNLKETFTQEKKQVFSNHPGPSGTSDDQKNVIWEISFISSHQQKVVEKEKLKWLY